MPIFHKQFSNQDLFRVNVTGPSKAWALRTAQQAAAMLEGRTPQRLTAWGHALEQQLNEIAASKANGSNPKQSAGETAQEVRWRCTDLQLMGAVDLARLRARVAELDEFDLLEQPVQLWQLYAVVALWKLADARQLLRRASDIAASDFAGAATHYAAARLPVRVCRAVAMELANSLVTEAAVAVSFAWSSYNRDAAESSAAWAMVGGDHAIAELEAIAKKKSEDSREGGYATQANARDGKQIARNWLINLSADLRFKKKKDAIDLVRPLLGVVGRTFTDIAIGRWLSEISAEPKAGPLRWPAPPKKRPKQTEPILPLRPENWLSVLASRH